MGTHDQIRSHEHHRLDRQIEEVVHDPYKERYRTPEPAVCPVCAVVFEHGAYHWKPRPAQAHEHTCPACRRTADQFPAGYVTLEGEFIERHRDELMQLVHNEAARARNEHPLERIMEIRRDGDATVITTTELHLARRIGDAIHHAYQGELTTQYAPDQYLVRVHWKR